MPKTLKKLEIKQELFDGSIHKIKALRGDKSNAVRLVIKRDTHYAGIILDKAEVKQLRDFLNDHLKH